MYSKRNANIVIAPVLFLVSCVKIFTDVGKNNWVRHRMLFIRFLPWFKATSNHQECKLTIKLRHLLS